jgi:hypothetical protein
MAEAFCRAQRCPYRAAWFDPPFRRPDFKDRISDRSRSSPAAVHTDVAAFGCNNAEGEHNSQRRTRRDAEAVAHPLAGRNIHAAPDSPLRL